MKTFNNILTSLKSTLLVTVMLLTCSAVWGADGDNHEWTSYSDWGESSKTSWLRNNNATLPTLTYTPTYAVKKVILNVRQSNTTGSNTIKVTIDGTQVGEIVSMSGTSAYDMEFTPTSAMKGAVVITCTNTSSSGNGKGTFYLNKITLTEGSSCTPATTSLTITSGNTVKTGKTLNLTSANGNDGTVEWSVVNGTGTASIEGNVLTAGNVGNVTVKAHQDQNGTYCEEDAERVVTIGAITYTDPITACAAQETASIAFSANGKTLKSESTLPATINDVPLNQPYSLSGVGSVEATGYTFVGWNSDKDATTKLDAFTPTEGKTYTMFAIWTTNQHKVTYVMDGGEGCDNIDAQAYGTVVDVCANPQKSGAVFKAWTSDDVVINNGQFTMPDKDVTITATWTPTHTAKFYNNEVEMQGTSVTVAEGAAITFPADPTPVKDTYTFQGWKTSKVSTTDTKPEGLVTEATMGNADVNYYAVFAIGTPGQPSSIYFNNLNVAGSSDTEISSITGWSCSNCFPNDGDGLRISSGKKDGTLTKNAISTFSGTATISFKVKAYSSTEAGKLTLSALNGGSLSETKVNVSATEWTSFSTTLSNGTGSTQIKMSGSSSNRIYVKDFDISVPGATTYSGYTTLIRTLQSIAVSGAPTKTEYTYGDIFEPAGLTVTGTYNVGEPAVITEGITWPNLPTVTSSSVNVTAKVGEITSSAYEVTGLTVNKKVGSITVENMSTHVGEQKTITPSTTSHIADVTYSIQSGSDKVSLDGNKVTGVEVGKATIRATLAANDEYAESYTDFTVTVESALITPTLTYNDVAIKTLEDNTLTPSEKTSDGAITYTIKSGSEYITLADGVVTAKAIGTAYVTASQQATATYTAKEVDIKVTVSKATPTLSVNNLTAYVGEADVAPVASTNNTDAYTITYSVEENDYISIVDNKVHAKANGEATVTATIAATDNFETTSTTFTATVQTRPLYKVTFYYKGGSKEETETAYQGGVTAPSVVAVGDYTFSGWATESVATETTTKPDYVALTEGKYYPTEENAKNLYAVYTTTKETETKGMWISYVGDETKYIGAADFKKSSGEYKGAFATSANTSGATTFYLEGKKLFWMSGTTKYYLQTGNSTDMCRVETAANATEWIITTGTTTTTFYNGSRYLANNGSKFSTYTITAQSTYGYNLTISTSTEGIIAPTAHYFSNPSAAVTPTCAFTNPTTSVQADAIVTNVVTTNSTGTVTYTSSNEEVAKVDNTGKVTGVGYGKATITANVAAVADTWNAATASYEISVTRITTTIAFNPNTMTVYTGNTYTLSVETNSDATPYYSTNSAGTSLTSFDGNKMTISAASGTWSSDKSFTLYGKVDQTSKYTAANASGTRAEATVTVKDNRRTQTIGVTTPAYNFVGGSTVADFTNTLTGEQVGEVTYKSNNEDLVTVSSTGVVHVNTANFGTATITVKAAKKDVVEEGTTFTYPVVSTSFTVTVGFQAPSFSPAACDIKTPIEVTLTAGKDAFIQYTTDGSDPDNNSDTYSDPIQINKTTTIKAYATDGDNSSSIVSATYTKILPQVELNVSQDENFTYGSKNVTITAPEGAVVSYTLYNSKDVELENKTDVQSATIILPAMGRYSLWYTAKWNCTDGFATDWTTVDFVATGAAPVPVMYNGDAKKANLPAYFTATGSIGSYDSGDTKIKFGNTGDALVLQIGAEAKTLNYNITLNGSDMNYNFQVEESANGSSYTKIHEYNSSNQIVAGVKTASLKSTTRYIRWKYVVKPIGVNIGIGNIQVLGDMSGSITVDGVNTSEIPDGFTGDVTVANGGNVELESQDMTFNNVTINAGGQFTSVVKVAVVNNLVIKSELGDLNNAAKSGQLSFDKLTVHGDAFFEVKIDPSGVASFGWYAVAVPFEVELNGGVYGKLQGQDWAALTNEKDFSIMQYQGDVRAKGEYGWIKVHKKTNKLVPGVFYLMSVADTDFGTIRFKKAADVALDNKAEITINEYAINGGVSGTDNGWNGVANNGLTYADLTFGGDEEKVLVYYHTSNSFDALTIEDHSFVVASPFFVQSPAGGDQLEFSTPTPPGELRAPMRETTSGEFNVRLGKNTDSYEDQLYLSATEDATADYQIGHEMVKNYMGTPKVAQMAIIGYNQELCDAEFQLNANNEAFFPMTITAPADGTYQLYVNRAMEDAKLYLTQDGTVIWDLTLGAYQVDLTKGTATNYGLKLVAQKKTPTDVENVYSNEDGVQKFIYNDNLYIVRDGKVFDAQGKLVK